MSTVLVVLRPDGPEVADAAAPVLPVTDLGVLRGESVFETLRLRNGRPVLLAEHLDRMVRSAAAVEVVLPARGLLEELAHTCATSWPEDDGSLRLVVTKGPDGAGHGTAAALASSVPEVTVAQRDGVAVVTLTLGVAAALRVTAPWLLGGVKSTAYAVNMASLRAAAAAGGHDALWVSSDGEVLEAPTATVAWVAGGTLWTVPAGEIGVLPSTTMSAARRVAHALGIPSGERRVTLAELLVADEVALLSSVRCVAPVTSVDGAPLPRGPVLAAVAAGYERACAAATDDAFDGPFETT